MKLVGFKTCPFAHKAMTIMKMKNIDCEIKFIEKENKPDWFLKLSPEGKVPLLILDNNEVIFESDAILEYIEEAFEPKVMVQDVFLRARHRAINYMVSSNFSVILRILEAKNKEQYEVAVKTLVDILSKIEAFLNENNDFVAGNKPSFADIALFVIFARVDILEKHFGCTITKSLPKISKLKNNLLKTNLTQTMVSDFTDVFIKRYKKDDSYICNL